MVNCSDHYNCYWISLLVNELENITVTQYWGRVVSVQGLLVEISGPLYAMNVGAHLNIIVREDYVVTCEVVGFKNNVALCLPFGEIDGVRMGCKAVLLSSEPSVLPNMAWLGRVVNGLGEPIDDKGPLPKGNISIPLRNKPPRAHKRARVGGPMDLGVRCMNSFTTCCIGQRMGIFAGSGVGKSVLLSMLARYTASDVAIIGLIGERGREVQEFIEDDLGEEGLKKSIVVVATGDESALMRKQSAYMTLSLAEYFRDQGKNVLCLMDSVTRFAMAQREIGLSSGEPPTSKGYTPTVFAELPKLLERAGPGELFNSFDHLEEPASEDHLNSGKMAGSITGLFTVLVDGDDHNEPVADAVRGILDGHIVMERSIAERGRFPAVNVLKSVSRTMPACVPNEWYPIIQKAKKLLATYADMEELIRLGAYREGTNPEVDQAIFYYDKLESFLSQRKEERTGLLEGYQILKEILEIPVSIAGVSTDQLSGDQSVTETDGQTGNPFGFNE